MSGSSKRAPQRGGASKNGWIIAAALVLVVVVAAVIAVVVRSGDGDEAADAESSGLVQNRPVSIEGQTLPEFLDLTPDPAVGQPAPGVVGASFDGTTVGIEPGSPTLLVFLAHWCPHCQAEVPALTQWEADGGIPEGVEVIGVATGTSADRPNYPPSAWLDREGFPFPVIADTEDGQLAQAFGLRSYPYFVVLDETGAVAARASGQLGVDQIGALLGQAL